MSFVTNLKRAFGFSEADEDNRYSPTGYNVDDPDGEDEEIINPFRHRPHGNEEIRSTKQPVESTKPEKDSHEISKNSVTVTIDEQLPGEIFDELIKLFNESMPDFVKSCLDFEAQRRYLYDSLSQNLRTKIERLALEAQSGANASDWEGSRRRLLDETDSLKRRISSLQKELDNRQRSLLSAERQKRALSDRAGDLEQQVSNLEKEREQLYSENKNMTARLKAASRGNNGAGGGVAADATDSNEAIIALKEALEKERKDNEMLRRDLETLDVKCKMADAMALDLRAQAAKANEELREAQEELAEAARAVEQIGLFEEYKKNKDIRVAELKRKIENQEREIESLKSTIKHNLTVHAETEENMRNEIAALKGEGGTSIDPIQDVSSEPRRRPNRHRGATRKKNRNNNDNDKGNSQMSLW